MPAMEIISEDVDIKINKEDDRVDLSVIEKAESFIEEQKDSIQEAFMTNHEEDGASFMTDVTGIEMIDCTEPLAELLLHYIEEHAWGSNEASTNLNTEYEEKVPELTELAVPVETSETVSSINAEWNKSSRSVLMMGNSALERSRLKRWEAAKDTARKERSDAGAGSIFSDLHVPLPIPLSLPLPVFIPHSRRRRTSAVMIQKCVRMFLLHRRAVYKSNQDNMRKKIILLQRKFRGILGRRIHKQLKVCFHRGMFTVRQSILKKQRSAKIIAKFFLAAVAVIRLKNFSWARYYRMYRGRDRVVSTGPSPIPSAQDDSHFTDDNNDDGEHRGNEQKEETEKEHEQKGNKDSSSAISRQAVTDRSARPAVVDSTCTEYRLKCGLDLTSAIVVPGHRSSTHTAKPTTPSSSSSTSSSHDKCSKITAAYHFLHISEKSPRGSFIGPLEGQSLGSIRAMRRSMSIDSTVNNITCPHINNRMSDPPSAPPSRVTALENRRIDFNAKFQIRNAMPQYSISAVDAGQAADRVGVTKARNNRTDRQNRIPRENSINVRTTLRATVESFGEVHEGVSPDCAVVITSQPFVLSSIQQKIECLLGQKSIPVPPRSLVLLPVLESRCSARGLKSTALLDSEAADIKAQVPGVRNPPMRLFQERSHMQRSVSFDVLTKLKHASLNHAAPSLLIPAHVQSSACPLVPATSSFNLPISLDMHQQHNGSHPMRSN